MSTKVDEKMARSPFSTPAFAQLVRRLRHTNARYNQIARQFRCRIRPTYHAKRRAYRAGLCIDVCKARALAAKHVSRTTPHTLARTAPLPTPPHTFTAAAESEELGVGQADAYMHLTNLPEVPPLKQRLRHGRMGLTIRLPPLALRLSLDVEYDSESDAPLPMPGAPRLLPRQLPEDESGVEEMTLGSALSASSFMESWDSLLTPSPCDDCTFSGLCITIPPRGVKRKLQDVEEDWNTAPFQQPKRILMDRWKESYRH